MNKIKEIKNANYRGVYKSPKKNIQKKESYE